MAADHDGQASCRIPVATRIQELTGVRIEPVDFAVVAGHEPDLAASWLAQAYRIAALDDMSRGFDTALELVREDLIARIVAHRTPGERIDASATVLARLAAYTAGFEAAIRREITVFTNLSRQIAGHGAYDLIGLVPEPAAAAAPPQT